MLRRRRKEELAAEKGMPLDGAPEIGSRCFGRAISQWEYFGPPQTKSIQPCWSIGEKGGKRKEGNTKVPPLLVVLPKIKTNKRTYPFKEVTRHLSLNAADGNPLAFEIEEIGFLPSIPPFFNASVSYFFFSFQTRFGLVDQQEKGQRRKRT